MQKALIVYYSQTGQLTDILKSVTKPLEKEFELVFEELQPKPDFPFPWRGMPFFQVFPESVMEIPCQLAPFQFNPQEEFNLIIVGVQVWYLSPSIPVSSFLQSKEAARVIKNKPVITVQGVRNMWTMSQERIKKKIDNLSGRLIGNIVLTDPNPNLISVVTIVRWAMNGEKHGRGLYGRIFPIAGVPHESITEAKKFGKTIKEYWKKNELQEELIKQAAIKIKPVIVTIEKRGYAMFRIWSRFILKKGQYNNPAREKRLKAFKYYLFIVIYLVSPVGSVVIWLIHKINPSKTRKMIQYYSGVK